MTSTNDGKDVKSNQTSPPKGKTYYIELYKSLDAALNAEGSLPERTSALCAAWRRVHTLCLHSAPPTHAHLQAWTQRHTARVILESEWQSPSSKDEHTKLTDALDAFIAECQAAITARAGAALPWETLLLQRAEWFKETLSNPWGHPVLKALLDPNGERPSNEQILEWLRGERGVVFASRLRQLALSRCDDLALTLLTTVMDAVRDSQVANTATATPPAQPQPSFESILNTEAGFSEVWDALTDMELVLLHKGGRSTRLIDLTKQMPLSNGYQLIDRLMSRLESAPKEKRLWKNAKEVAMLATQVLITRCMVVPTCTGPVRTVLYWCGRALSRALPAARLRAATAVLAAPAATARHLHTFATAVHAQQTTVSSELQPFVVELYVRAITFGMNELEKLKLKPEYKETEARSTEQTLASWFIQLGELLSASARMKCECVLTAFSVHPSPAYYEKIKLLPPTVTSPVDAQDIKKDDTEPTSDFGSWANDSRSQTNFVKTSSTLNMKQTQQASNVLSPAILSEGEALGLAAELCQDLTVLLAGPRVKTLAAGMDRELLLENCRSYMERTSGGTRALTTELKYLNLDPQDFQHLPEEEDDENDVYYGIEKGYEHLVELQEPQPEEIWEDAIFDSERTDSACSSSQEDDFLINVRKKKNKNAPLAPEIESDPLSLDPESKHSENKRVEKKERPHSKERSKESKKKHKEKHNKEHDRRKNEGKEKKPRKKREKKDTAPQGPMSHLVGAKITNNTVATKEQTAQNICVTDSDYDSQGKSSMHSEGNDPDVLYDGQFSMDELKSPDKRSPDSINKNLHKSIELSIASGQVAMNKLQINSQTPPPLVWQREQIKPIRHSDSPTPQTFNQSLVNRREDVKKRIAELIQFRRQKTTEAVNAALYANQNNVNQGLQAVNHRQSVISVNQNIANQSAVNQKQNVVNLNQNAGNQSQIATNQDKSAINKNPKVLNHYFNAETPPAQQQGAQNMSAFIGSKLVKQCGQQIFAPVQAFDKNNASSSTCARTNMLHQEKSEVCSRVQPFSPQHSRKTQPKLSPQQQLLNAMNNTVNQLNALNQANQEDSKHTAQPVNAADNIQLQEFLKETQRSANAGLNIPSRSVTPEKRKDIKPVSRVTPVIPNVIQNEPNPLLQCAKPIVQQKKVENAPNTFARLSYMHKNKQNEKTKNCEQTVNASEVSPLQSSISAELDRRIADLARTKEIYYQNKNHYIANRTVNHTVPQKPVEPPRVNIPRAAESNLTNGNIKIDLPVLTKLLNAGVTVTNYEHNRDQLIRGQTTSKSASTLSEKDQEDIKNLLSQKNLMNPSPSQFKISNSSVTRIASQTFPTSSVIKNNSPSPVTQNKYPTEQATTSKSQEKILDPKRDIHMHTHENSFFPVISNSTIQKTTDLIQTKKSHGKSHGKSKETALNCKKIIAGTNNTQKTILEESKPTVVVPKQTEEVKQQDWSKVLDALCAQKTPNRGPNALNMVLNRESFANVCKQPPTVKTGVHIPGDKAKKTAINAKVQVPTPKPTSFTALENHPIMKKVGQPKKQSPIVTKKSITPSHVIYPEVTKQSYQCKLQKEDDPFISGIQNSDYEILEELMDDDLRQEIGELSSDEDNYRSLNEAAPKALKIISNTKMNALVNKTIHDKPKQNINTARTFEIRADTTKVNTPPASVSKTDPKLKIISNEKVDFGKISNMLGTNVIRNLPKTFTPVPERGTIISKAAPNAHVTVSTPVPQTNLNPNMIFTTQSIVKNVVYDPVYLEMCKIHQYTVANETAKVVVCQPQFTTAMPGQVLIDAVTIPTVTVIPPSKVSINIAGNNQIAASNVSLQMSNTIPVATTSAECTKQAALNASLSNQTKNVLYNEEKIQANPINVIKPKQIDRTDFNVNKNSERKVLSEVQQKLKVLAPENTETVKSKIHKSEKRNEVSKDEERLAKKRFAILNRVVHRRSYSQAIPLKYAPLKVFTNTDSEKGHTIAPPSRKRNNDKNSTKKVVVKTLRNAQKADIKANKNTKENKEKPQGIVITCSDKVQHKVQETPSDSPKRRKCKVRQKSTVINKAKTDKNNSEIAQKKGCSIDSKTEKSTDKDITLDSSDKEAKKPEHNANTSKVETVTPTRVSKRILNKKIKKTKEKAEKVRSFEKSKEQHPEVNKIQKEAPPIDKPTDDRVQYDDIEDAILGNKIFKAVEEDVNQTSDKSQNTDNEGLCRNCDIQSFSEKPKIELNTTEKKESISETIEILSSPEVSHLDADPLSKINITKPDSEIENVTKSKNVSPSVLHDTALEKLDAKKTESLSEDGSSHIVTEAKDTRKGLKNASIVTADSVQEKVNMNKTEAQGKLLELVDNIESAINAITESTISSPLIEANDPDDINVSTKLDFEGITSDRLSNSIEVTSFDKQHSIIDTISSNTEKLPCSKGKDDTPSEITTINKISNNTKNLLCSKSKDSTLSEITEDSIIQSIKEPIITSDSICNKNVMNISNDKNKLQKCTSGKLFNTVSSTANKITNDTSEIHVATELPQSYKDSIKMEEVFMATNKAPNVRYFRITMPNKKVFKAKATISGKVNVSVNTLFEDPQLKNIFLNDFNDKKRYTLNIQQVSTVDNNVVNTRIQGIVVNDGKPAKVVETVNLISDDEDEPQQNSTPCTAVNEPQQKVTTGSGTVKDELQEVTTAAGVYKIKLMDKDILDKHQQKLSQKCTVALHRCDAKSKLPELDTLVNSILEDLITPTPQNTSEVITVTEEILDVIDLDDSSNEGDTELQEENKLDHLKNLLLQELGVSDIVQSTNQRSDTMDSKNKLCGSANIARLDDPKLICDCYVKLINCDNILNKFTVANVANDGEVIVCDDESDTASVRSRSGSFSILNNLEVFDDILPMDDENSPIIDTTNAPQWTSASGRNSPVMAIFDIIAALQENNTKAAEKSNFTSVGPDLVCKSEWFMTKRDIYSLTTDHISECDFVINSWDNKNDISSDCDTDVTDISLLDGDDVKTLTVPSLSSIMAKYFEDSPIVNQLTPSIVKTTVPVSLKRKSTDQDQVTSYKHTKVSNLLQTDNLGEILKPGDDFNQKNNLEPEGGFTEIDTSMASVEELPDVNATSECIDNCPSPSLLTEDLVSQLPDFSEMTTPLETLNVTVSQTESGETNATFEINNSILDETSSAGGDTTPEILFDTSNDAGSIPTTEIANTKTKVADDMLKPEEFLASDNSAATVANTIVSSICDEQVISNDNSRIDNTTEEDTVLNNDTVTAKDTAVSPRCDQPQTSEAGAIFDNDPVTIEDSDETLTTDDNSRTDNTAEAGAIYDNSAVTGEDTAVLPKCYQSQTSDNISRAYNTTEASAIFDDDAVTIEDSDETLTTDDNSRTDNTAEPGATFDSDALTIKDTTVSPISDEPITTVDNSRSDTTEKPDVILDNGAVTVEDTVVSAICDEPPISDVNSRNDNEVDPVLYNGTVISEDTAVLPTCDQAQTSDDNSRTNTIFDNDTVTSEVDEPLATDDNSQTDNTAEAGVIHDNSAVTVEATIVSPICDEPLTSDDSSQNDNIAEAGVISNIGAVTVEDTPVSAICDEPLTTEDNSRSHNTSEEAVICDKGVVTVEDTVASAISDEPLTSNENSRTDNATEAGEDAIVSPICENTDVNSLTENTAEASAILDNSAVTVKDISVLPRCDQSQTLDDNSQIDNTEETGETLDNSSVKVELTTVTAICDEPLSADDNSQIEMQFTEPVGTHTSVTEPASCSENLSIQKADDTEEMTKHEESPSVLIENLSRPVSQECTPEPEELITTCDAKEFKHTEEQSEPDDIQNRNFENDNVECVEHNSSLNDSKISEIPPQEICNPNQEISKSNTADTNFVQNKEDFTELNTKIATDSKLIQTDMQDNNNKTVDDCETEIRDHVDQVDVSAQREITPKCKNNYVCQTEVFIEEMSGSTKLNENMKKTYDRESYHRTSDDNIGQPDGSNAGSEESKINCVVSDSCDGKEVVVEKSIGELDENILERHVTLVYKDDSGLVLKGIEYEDPEIGTCFVFPIVSSDFTEPTQLLSENVESTIEIIREGETTNETSLMTKEIDQFSVFHDETDLHVIEPKRTYSARRHLKRKSDTKDVNVCSKRPRRNSRARDSSDIKIPERKYRKGKRIDMVKQSKISIDELSYKKEFKLLLDYQKTISFSYAISFCNQYIDVPELITNWPIKGSITKETEDQIGTSYGLFVDIKTSENRVRDPMHLTLLEEITAEYNDTDYSNDWETDTTTFNVGFGEGSGRVNQNLDGGAISKFSAATLSDVKHSQPFLQSKDGGDSRNIENFLESSKRQQIQTIKRFFNYMQLRDKVRSFFKNTAIELACGIEKEKMRDKKNNVEPPLLCELSTPKYIKPNPIETVVQVVQVGQLPVSAAAQNPVTCDPRVTQVSDASPSQCSAGNSPHDDSQAEIKTEYTELTTAEMSMPMVGEYMDHNQTENMESQEPRSVSQEDIPIKTEIIKSEVKIEIMEETDEKEQNFEESEVDNHVNNVDYLYNTNNTNTSVEAEFQALFGEEKQQSSEPITEQKQQNGSSEKTDQIAHAMNAAGITTSSETSQAQALVNLLSNKMRQGVVTSTQNSVNNYPKTSINTISLQQALAQILPPPLNQTSNAENNQQGQNQVAPVLHIVQGKNAAGNQITLVDNSQQSVITTPNATPVLHIVQNKAATGTTSTGSAPQANTFSGISLVDAGLQQGGNQLLHIVNTGSQNKNNAGQLLKRVNLLTNLTNVQGSNEQKMVQFVCKSADGKAIQLNAPHQRSMVLRLQPIETPNIQTAPPKPAESQVLSPTPNTTNSASKEPATTQQEIKSRSVYEENYAKFIQNSTNKSSLLEKSTSLPKFNQAFGKQIYQDGKQTEINSNNSHLPNVNNNENTECQPPDNSINLDHIGQISSPPLLLRKSPQTSQAQTNIVQQIKQTIAPMNIQTMHGGVIYTRQIPVNIGGGQTINLITVPSTELIDESGQKQVNQGEIEPSIIKIVPQSQPNAEAAQDDMNVSGENGQNPPQPQQVLTQMRIKLPMLSKNPQMVAGTRVVRPSFFQIQRNVIAGTNQPVYQQLVLTAAPPLGQQTIRLPQAPVRQIKVPESQSSSESQMSSSTLEQLREFDMVLEQVKERSTVQPNSNSSTSTNTSYKIHTTSTDTTDSAATATSTTTETTQVLYSIGGSQPLNVAYVNRKTTITTPTTSSFNRSPDSSGIADSPSSSTHVQIPQTSTTEASSSESATPQPKPAKVSSKKKHRSSSHSHSSSMKLSSIPPKTSTQKPLEDEQTTQRILYILAEYKEQVENSPDKDKPAPRRRSNPPTNPSGSSKRKKSSSCSRRSGGRDVSPVDDSCRTMGSEDSSCGTSQGDCTENCLETTSPQDSPRKVARKLNFEQETNATPAKPQPQRNVIVADGQTITVARGTAGKPATAVLMPANYILPVSMVKGGQQIAIVTNRGPKLLTVGGGEGGATNTLLLQRLIGPAGLKPVLARPGVRHVRLPTAALHNLQTFNLATTTTSAQPPDSTASPATELTPPELVDTRAEHSPWADKESETSKPERASSPDDSEPWNLPSSADNHDYSYEETVRADNMDRTVLVVQKKDSSQRQARLAHVSAAALRHKYAILEHELRLQKSLSEECEDLGVDSPSASELFPEAELLFATSPAQDHGPDTPHTPQTVLHSQTGIHPDIDDQIATDQLLPRANLAPRQMDGLGLEDVGIVTVSEGGMPAAIALDQEEFARHHPNTTFHSEPSEGEVQQPFTISGLKTRHITSTIFHANRAPATVLMTAPQTTVISQATVEGTNANPVKYSDIDNMINSLPHQSSNTINLSSVLVKDDGLTRFDSILTDSRELHLSNTASAIVHSTGSATQVIRRVCYDDDNKRDRDRLFLDEPDGLIAGEDAKMMAEDSSRDATMESMADVDDDNSSPERHAELFWESNSASERSESRRPMDFSSDSEKCCKSPSYDENNSTDSSGVGTHMRLDSVIKEARRDRSDGSSAEDTHPPLRTYPAKRLYHSIEGEVERSLSGKTRAGERSPDSVEVRRRASVRGVVKRGCHCCNGSPAPTRPKKPRQRKPTMDFNAN